ncbi:MAG TPA: sulfur carrier protein ThiS [Turneriella sp.]|nr:sulfur carrier protein ThiS [Turneriella sp.]
MIVNGESLSLASVAKPHTLASLITHFSLAPQRVAVELNGALVPRNAYTTTTLNDNDTVELIHYVGGG